LLEETETSAIFVVISLPSALIKTISWEYSRLFGCCNKWIYAIAFLRSNFWDICWKRPKKAPVREKPNKDLLKASEETNWN